MNHYQPPMMPPMMHHQPPPPRQSSAGTLFIVFFLVAMGAGVVKGIPYVKQRIHLYQQEKLVKESKIDKLEREIAKLRRDSEKAKNRELDDRRKALEAAELKLAEQKYLEQKALELKAKREAEALFAAKKVVVAKPRAKPFRSSYVQPRYASNSGRPAAYAQAYTPPPSAGSQNGGGDSGLYEDLSSDVTLPAAPAPARAAAPAGGSDVSMYANQPAAEKPAKKAKAKPAKKAKVAKAAAVEEDEDDIFKDNDD